MASAEIITIGTEILLGEIVDTNTRYIARALRGLGVNLFRTITIGDNTERIAAEIHASMQHTNIIITTGGLGPTVDDPTREAVAKAAGVEVEFREELWEQISAIFVRYGRKPTENQKRQAYVPKGSIALNNPVGTAPCFIVEYQNANGDGAIISLPGVPSEMEHILHESVIPYLQKKFKLHEIIKVRLIRLAGIGEGMIDDKIGDLEKLTNPTVGLAAHSGVVDVRIAAKAENETQANSMIAEIEAQVRERLGSAVFGVDEDTLESITFNAVERCGWKLILLESGLPESIKLKLPGIASLPRLQADSLTETVRAAQANANATAALGIVLFLEERVAEFAVLTPNGDDIKRITYGGPVKTFPRWVLSNALNALRLKAEEKN